MATLHFDTEAGRATSAQLRASASELQTQMSNLNQRVNAMVGAEWIGNSATQFQGEFQSWSQQLQNVIQQLETLQQRLDREIADWEAAASALN